MIDRRFFVIIIVEEESRIYKGDYMKLLLYFLLALAIYYTYILLCFILKRLKLLRKIKCFADKNNIEYRISLFPFFIPSNQSNTALLLKTSNAVYNIRLFGLLRKNCAVHFWSKEQYSVEKFIPRMSLVDTPLGHRPVRRRKLGKWDISANTEIPVLLYSPANSPIHITQTKVNHVERLIAGDMIEDILFVDIDFLFRYIENRL